MTRGEKVPQARFERFVVAAAVWTCRHADMPTCPAGDIKGESKLQLKRSKTQDQTAGQVPQRKNARATLQHLQVFQVIRVLF